MKTKIILFICVSFWASCRNDSSPKSSGKSTGSLAILGPDVGTSSNVLNDGFALAGTSTLTSSSSIDDMVLQPNFTFVVDTTYDLNPTIKYCAAQQCPSPAPGQSQQDCDPDSPVLFSSTCSSINVGSASYWSIVGSVCNFTYARPSDPVELSNYKTSFKKIFKDICIRGSDSCKFSDMKLSLNPKLRNSISLKFSAASSSGCVFSTASYANGTCSIPFVFLSDVTIDSNTTQTKKMNAALSDLATLINTKTNPDQPIELAKAPSKPNFRFTNGLCSSH